MNADEMQSLFSQLGDALYQSEFYRLKALHIQKTLFDRASSRTAERWSTCDEAPQQNVTATAPVVRSAVEVQRLDPQDVTPETIASAFKAANRLTGTLSRVGRNLGVTASHVRSVALGERKSERVTQELLRDWKEMLSGERAA